MTVELHTRAAELGASTVHEAAGRIGALPSTIKPIERTWRLAGPAYPVATTPGVNVWIHDAIDRAPAGSVLVVTCGGYREAGYWGEIMSTAAIARGLAGLVIDGGVRDIELLREMPFPVFAANVCLRGTTKQRRPRGTCGVPVRVGDVTVAAGDLVVGDADGVVVIPSADADAAVAAGVARSQHEAAVMARLRAGESTLDIYGWRESEH